MNMFVYYHRKIVYIKTNKLLIQAAALYVSSIITSLTLSTFSLSFSHAFTHTVACVGRFTVL